MASKSTQKKKTTRKLTAILCADVVGSSDLMGGDSEGTLATRRRCREALGSPFERRDDRVFSA